MCCVIIQRKYWFLLLELKCFVSSNCCSLYSLNVILEAGGKRSLFTGVSPGEAPHLGTWIDPSKSTGCAAHGEPMPSTAGSAVGRQCRSTNCKSASIKPCSQCLGKSSLTLCISSEYNPLVCQNER